MWRIPLCDLNYDINEERAVIEVLRSKWLTMGPKTEEFEAQAAEYLGVKHAIAVANCTCALEMAYQFAFTAGSTLPDGTERRRSAQGRRRGVVLAPDITFVATANAAIASGGIPEFVDVLAPDVPFMSLASASEALLRRKGVVCAVAVMHYAGFDSNAQDFLQLAQRHDVLLVEDAAHAMGGFSSSGRRLGTIGDIGCFSFFSNKNMATGEGGLVVTNRDDAAQALRLMRSHGMTTLTYERHASKRHGYDVLAAGHNFRCTEIAAAIALEQLKKLDAANERRRQLYHAYAEQLDGLEQAMLLFANTGNRIKQGACHILPLLCRTSELRDKVRAALDEAEIQTSHHYPPLHSFTFYRKMRSGESFINAIAFSSRQITLPLHPGLQEQQVSEICGVIKKAL